MTRKPWFLYLIECQDGSIYTGITIDIAARYAAHANGTGARYTRSHPPQRLLAVFEHADRSAASKAEYAMKKLTAEEKRKVALNAGSTSLAEPSPTPGSNQHPPTTGDAATELKGQEGIQGANI